MKRRTRHWLGLFLLPLALGGCGTAPDETEITLGPSDRWNVSVLGPRDGSIDHCLEDPLIEESIQSANLPSTHLGINLLETAKQEDAERIADCLRESLISGEVSIRSPRK